MQVRPNRSGATETQTERKFPLQSSYVFMDLYESDPMTPTGQQHQGMSARLLEVRLKLLLQLTTNELIQVCFQIWAERRQESGLKADLDQV